MLFVLSPLLLLVSQGGAVPLLRRVTAVVLGMGLALLIGAFLIFAITFGGDYASTGLLIVAVSLVALCLSLAIVLPKGRRPEASDGPPGI